MSQTVTSDGSRRRFELKRRIGVGAFGEVYLADVVSAGGFRRPVAVKVLNESAAKMREAAVRMRDEARILGMLSHRHLVDVIDLVKIGNRWAIVMAYVPGADLEQILADFEPQADTFPARAVAEIGMAVARALDAAWSSLTPEGQPLHVIHRDIKPSNIRISPDGDLKVLDFGVARIQNLDSREAMTKRQGLIGTERYMAPERILLEGDGPDGDIYALGATLVELLLGVAIGRSPVRDEAHAAFVTDICDDLRGKLPDTDPSKAFIALIRQMLSGDRVERPTARQFVDTLEPLWMGLQGESLTAFCARVVPGVAERARLTDEEMTGTLLEDSTDKTWLDGASLPPPKRARGMRQIRVLLMLLILMFALSALLFLMGLWRLQDVTPSSNQAPGPQVATTPIVASPPPVVPALIAPDLGDVQPEPSKAPQPEPSKAPQPEPSSTPSTPRPPKRDVAKDPSPSVEKPASLTLPSPAPIAADAPRVSRALVVVDTVDGFEVTCGDVSARGSGSARLANFPSGMCTVIASRGGARWHTQVSITTPAAIHCSVIGDGLVCQ